MKIILSILFFGFFAINCFSQENLQYNIVVNEKNDTLQFDYEIVNPENKTQNKYPDNFHAFMASLFSDLNTLPKEKNQVLFYIHGMWGGKRFAFNRTFRMMEKHYLDSDESDIGRVVSIIWPGNKMEYKVNKKKLYEITPEVSEWFDTFIKYFHTYKFAFQLNNVNLDLIAHSLGTELLKEIICKLPVSEYPFEVIEEMIFAAPDLVTNIFQTEECFGNKLAMAKRAHVYFSSRDLTLGVSNNLNDIDRLGRAGPSANSEIPSNVYFVDVSEIKDDKNMSDLLTGHSYFRASPKVAGHMRKVLIGLPLNKLEVKIVDEEKNVYTPN